jgi:streptogramin lyase
MSEKDRNGVRRASILTRNSLLMAAILLALAACGGDPGPDRAARSPAPTTEPLPDLGGEQLGDRLIEAIPIGKGGGGLAAGFGSVWAENHRSYSISRIDPVTNTAVAEIPAGEHTCGVVVAESGVWVPSFDGVRRIDPATNQIDQTIKVNSCAVAVTEDRIWSAGEEDAVQAFDPETAEVTASIEAGPDPFVVEARDEIWVLDRTPDLWRIDASTAEVVDRIRLAREEPYWTDLAVGKGAVWVALGGVLERRSIRTLEVEKSVDFGTHPLWISAGGEHLWVTAANREEVWRIDPVTLEVLDTLKIGDYAGPFLEAFGDGWVSTLNRNALYRVDLDA